MKKDNTKNVAAVLSFVFSGLGQLYNGQIAKGLFMIFFSVVGIFCFGSGALLIYLWLSFPSLASLLWMGIILALFGLVLICMFALYSIVDAHRNSHSKG